MTTLSTIAQTEPNLSMKLVAEVKPSTRRRLGKTLLGF